jgi:membrane-bound serine protease (ClpP class)
MKTRSKRIAALGLIAAVGLFSAAANAGGILRLSLDGSINPVSRDVVVRAIGEAEARAAELLLIELNTPGGLEESMRDIVAAELASAVPVVVFVSPSGARAASAGVFLTIAADVAAMAPGTNIGAAHPVNLIGGGTPEGEQDTSMDKAANDAAAFARSIAEQRGRNVGWAESAVLQSSALSAVEALDQGVIDLIAADTDDLLERLDGYALPDGRVLHTRGVEIVEIRPTLRDRLLSLLADPNLVYVLFILGLYGLIYEFFHPGIGFGLAAGGVCLLLALFGLQVLPVNIAGIALILFGMGLIVLDAFTPTNGILTVGGVVGLLAGSLTLFDSPDRSIGLSWGTIVAVVGFSAAVSVFVLSKGLMIQRKRPMTGAGGLVGTAGTVRGRLDPDGTVFVHGEYWTARSIDGPIGVGEAVRVDRVEGKTLIVRRDG